MLMHGKEVRIIRISDIARCRNVCPLKARSCHRRGGQHSEQPMSYSLPTKKVVKDAEYVELPCLELSFDDAVIVLDLSEKPTGHSRQVTLFCSDCDAVHPWRLAVFDQTCTEKFLPGCKVFATSVQALSILDSMYHVLKQQNGSAPCKPCMVKLDWPKTELPLNVQSRVFKWLCILWYDVVLSKGFLLWMSLHP